MVNYYRISDSQQRFPNPNRPSRDRPPYFDKLYCLENFIAVFGSDDVVIVADKVSEANRRRLTALIGDRRRVIGTEFGSGGHSFLACLEDAVKTYADDDIVYLIEDDYLHRPGARDVLPEGLAHADYVTGFDHPDKYIADELGGNPLVTGGGEETRVLLTRSSHWKYTNSTTMTFMARVATLRQDREVFHRHCGTGYPYDYQLFRELCGAGRRLASTIPAQSTTLELPHIGPLVDWEAVQFATSALYRKRKR